MNRTYKALTLDHQGDGETLIVVEEVLSSKSKQRLESFRQRFHWAVPFGTLTIKYR